MKTFVAGAATLLAMTLSASAEMPKIKTGLKISDPRPTSSASPSNTAVLNNQTFMTPKSVVGNAQESRRMRALSLLPSRQRGSAVAPVNPYGMPTTIVASGKAAANGNSALTARRLPNAPARRCPAGAWTC